MKRKVSGTSQAICCARLVSKRLVVRKVWVSSPTAPETSLLSAYNSSSHSSWVKWGLTRDTQSSPSVSDWTASVWGRPRKPSMLDVPGVSEVQELCLSSPWCCWERSHRLSCNWSWGPAGLVDRTETGYVDCIETYHEDCIETSCIGCMEGDAPKPGNGKVTYLVLV